MNSKPQGKATGTAHVPDTPAAPGWLAGFPPGYFSMSMATGIVAIDSRLLGHGTIGQVLFAIDVAAYTVLWAIMLARLWRYPRAVAADFRHYAKGPTFLTVVAASSLIGSQCAVFGVALDGLAWMLGATAVLWTGLTYGFLAVVTVSAAKPGIERGLHGTWLLLVVATQSLAVLGSFVAAASSAFGEVAFLSLAAFLLGSVLYLILLGLIFFRWTFVPMTAAELGGPWWINMGAAAITTLASSRLMLTAPLHELGNFLTACSVASWATATFWLPWLVLVFAWKHAVERQSLQYGLGVWSVVFPLGMYTAANETFARASHLVFLHALSHAAYWIALAAWCASAAGMLRGLLRFANRREKGRAT